MILAFQLTMPNVGSWNGRWSGEGRLYVLLKRFTSKSGKIRAKQLLAGKSYYYSWNDGWGASVSVRKVDPKDARRLKRESKGFCGYDWMVDSIITHGEILDTKQRELKEQEKPCTE